MLDVSVFRNSCLFTYDISKSKIQIGYFHYWVILSNVDQ